MLRIPEGQKRGKKGQKKKKRPAGAVVTKCR